MAEPRNTVLRWVKACMEELVQEEMGSGTQVDQDDFKAAVELFKNRLEAVDAEIKQSRKSKEARLQSFLRPLGCKKQMVFDLMTRLFQALIQKFQHYDGHRLLLNASARKRKRDAESNEKPSNDAILLAEFFGQSTGILAKTLIAGRSSNSLPAPAPMPHSIVPLPATPTISRDSANIGELNERMTKVETGLGGMISELGDVKSELGDMKTMLGRIFAVISSGAQGAGTPDMSIPNASSGNANAAGANDAAGANSAAGASADATQGLES